MNIIYDICDDILLETSLIDILTKYDDFNIKMLNFIKSKNKLYFELLDKFIIFINKFIRNCCIFF